MGTDGMVWDARKGIETNTGEGVFACDLAEVYDSLSRCMNAEHRVILLLLLLTRLK